MPGSAIELAVNSLQEAETNPALPDAEYREYIMHHYETRKATLYLYDTPLNAVLDLGIGWYSIASYNHYGLRKLMEVRPKGQDLESLA